MPGSARFSQLPDTGWSQRGRSPPRGAWSARSSRLADYRRVPATGRPVHLVGKLHPGNQLRVRTQLSRGDSRTCADRLRQHLNDDVRGIDGVGQAAELVAHHQRPAHRPFQQARVEDDVEIRWACPGEDLLAPRPACSRWSRSWVTARTAATSASSHRRPSPGASSSRPDLCGCRACRVTVSMTRVPGCTRTRTSSTTWLAIRPRSVSA